MSNIIDFEEWKQKKKEEHINDVNQLLLEMRERERTNNLFRDPIDDSPNDFFIDEHDDYDFYMRFTLDKNVEHELTDEELDELNDSIRELNRELEQMTQLERTYFFKTIQEYEHENQDGHDDDRS